jgi:hypothetical protein
MRRKYITLCSTIVFIVFFILNSYTKDVNDWSKHYYEIPILLFQITLCYLVFRSKNNDSKNLLTGMNVILTIACIIFYVYSVVVELDLENFEAQ